YSMHDLDKNELTGKDVQEALIKAGITVNKNMVPFDSQPPTITSGIRVGTAAMTTRGFLDHHFRQVVEWIDTIVNNIDDEDIIKDVKIEAQKMALSFSLYPELTIEC